MNSLTSLYSHQQRAVDKLLRSRVGALFMEMGTGKTRTAIEFVLLRQARIDRVVWFCPVSLKVTIEYEIYKHVSGVRVYVFDDKTSQENLPPADWYIVGIESMSSSKRVVLAARSLVTESTFVIVDESSYIKGHRASRTQRITTFSEPARYRLLLTGTPVSQGVVDLFAQMRFLSPSILGYHSFYSFAANHLEYSDKYKGMIVRAHNVGLLSAKIQPYTYQVTKAECLDLPGKLFDSRYCKLSEEQAYAYWRAKEEILGQAEELNSYIIFQCFTALQEIVSGYWNYKTRAGNFRLLEFPHHRLETLQSVLNDIPGGEKVIIWCKFQYSVRSIRTVLTREYGPGCLGEFHGRLSERERAAELEKFRNSARFFLATTPTGGHGLTLNEAHYVVFYENGFKYAERIQAEDRCHRIGQGLPVTYIDIVCDNSIDERIAKALAKKADVVESFRREVEKVKDKKDKKAALLEGL